MKLEDDTTTRVNVESLRRLELINPSTSALSQPVVGASTTDEVNVDTAVKWVDLARLLTITICNV